MMIYLFHTIDLPSFGFSSLGGFSFADLAQKSEGFAFGSQGVPSYWHFLENCLIMLDISSEEL